MVSVISLDVVIIGSNEGWLKPMTYKIGIFAELRSKGKDWLVRNQDTMSEWSNKHIQEMLNQCAGTKDQITHVGLIQSGPVHQLIACNYFPQ